MSDTIFCNDDSFLLLYLNNPTTALVIKNETSIDGHGLSYGMIHS